MNKICTDLDQSKKLLELGMNTADMMWCFDDISDEPFLFPYLTNIYEDSKDIPAWSLVALEGLMPFHIIVNNNRYDFYQVKGFNKQGEMYRFGYKTNEISYLYETSWHNDVVDAAFEMVCWLKENNII